MNENDKQDDTGSPETAGSPSFRDGPVFQFGGPVRPLLPEIDTSPAAVNRALRPGPLRTEVPLATFSAVWEGSARLMNMTGPLNLAVCIGDDCPVCAQFKRMADEMKLRERERRAHAGIDMGDPDEFGSGQPEGT